MTVDLLDPGARRRATRRRLDGARDARPGHSRERDDLVQRLRPLARRLARRYARRPADLEDLEQVACLGLVKAIDRFDPERGVQLATYARAVVLGELKHWVRDNAWGVKVPRPAKELSVRIEAVVPELTAELGRSPTIAEISAAVEADRERVLAAIEARAAATPESLDSEAPANPRAPAPGAWEDPGFSRAEDRATLEPALRALCPRDRLVLDMRFSADMSQSEIAAALGLSVVHVSRILRRALERAARAA